MAAECYEVDDRINIYSRLIFLRFRLNGTVHLIMKKRVSELKTLMRSMRKIQSRVTLRNMGRETKREIASTHVNFQICLQKKYN